MFLETECCESRSMETMVVTQNVNKCFLLLRYQVYLKMGFTQEELDAHFAGPAFFAW